jgi:hypothetical protein
MSGKSNVVFWLERHGYPVDDVLVDRIFTKAKSSSMVLTADEILEQVAEHTRK